jgi:hypothetical protein
VKRAEKPVARRQVEIVEASQQECRLAVVEVPAGVDGDEHVVVEVLRVVVWRLLVAAFGVGESQDLPGARAEEVLTRDGCEGVDQGGGAQRGDRPDLLCELATDSVEALHGDHPLLRANGC